MPEDPTEEDRESPPLHANDLVDKPVFDVNGLLLGRVTLAREASDHLLGFDVTLRERLRERLDASDAVVTVMPDLIVAAGEEITLSESGENILHPERQAPPSHE